MPASDVAIYKYNNKLCGTGGNCIQNVEGAVNTIWQGHPILGTVVLKCFLLVHKASKFHFKHATFAAAQKCKFI